MPRSTARDQVYEVWGDLDGQRRGERGTFSQVSHVLENLRPRRTAPTGQDAVRVLQEFGNARRVAGFGACQAWMGEFSISRMLPEGRMEVDHCGFEAALKRIIQWSQE